MGLRRADTEGPLSVTRDPEQYWLGQNILKQMSNTNHNNPIGRTSFNHAPKWMPTAVNILGEPVRAISAIRPLSIYNDQ